VGLDQGGRHWEVVVLLLDEASVLETLVSSVGKPGSQTEAAAEFEGCEL
jgi:hypothetical protein